MATIPKPERYQDQAEADFDANSFVEAVAKKWNPTMPGVRICRKNLADCEGGSVSAVWGHGERVLLAAAVVVRDGANYSLLFTREFMPEPQMLGAPDAVPGLLMECEKHAWKLGALLKLGEARDKMARADVDAVQRFLMLP